MKRGRCDCGEAIHKQSSQCVACYKLRVAAYVMAFGVMDLSFTYCAACKAERGAMTKRVWIDLETTGLLPESDLILEAAVVITEGADLKEIAYWSAVVHYPESVLLARCNPWCEKQHRASGLWDDCVNGSLSSDAVFSGMRDALALAWQPPPIGNVGPMCGAGVGRFDRLFLRKHAPGIEAMFHYRDWDVSTYREHLPLLNVSVPPKAEAHRALADVRESIALARYASALLTATTDMAAAVADGTRHKLSVNKLVRQIQDGDTIPFDTTSYAGRVALVNWLSLRRLMPAQSAWIVDRLHYDGAPIPGAAAMREKLFDLLIEVPRWPEESGYAHDSGFTGTKGGV